MTTVQPEKILKDLANLWVDLGKEGSPKSHGVLRACAMTLIAAVEEEADAQAAGETIANLVHQHPSRVIVMRVTGEEGAGLDARVFAQCWMPFGRRQQICCEQIEITAGKSRVDDLPKLVLGIMAPDLPVVLWCRGERLPRDAAFQHLFPLTDKIIVDSAAFADSEAALGFIRELTGQGRNVGDLAWTRLTHLRDLVAQMFENECARAGLKSLRKATIFHSGGAPTALHYMRTWLTTTLPVPVETVVRRDRPGVRFEGPNLTAEVRIDDEIAEIQVNQLTRRMSLPKRTDCDLLREELSILSPDPIYRKCLA